MIYMDLRPYYRRRYADGMITIFLRDPRGNVMRLSVDSEQAALFEPGKFYTVELS